MSERAECAMIRKPGPGWTAFSLSPVYQHTSGLRVHVMGLCRMPNGGLVSAAHWPEDDSLRLAVRMQGGNRLRGAMLWAMWLLERERAKREETP